MKCFWPGVDSIRWIIFSDSSGCCDLIGEEMGEGSDRLEEHLILAGTDDDRLGESVDRGIGEEISEM